MLTVSLSALRDRTGGELIGVNVGITGLSIDSRVVHSGDLFAAIKGSRVDGHDYAHKALSGGASALLTERVLEGLSPQLVVSDVVKATGDFGYLKRADFSGKVIGITGSAGKTTTKNLLSAALSSAGPVLATQGNRNNELGVPLTLAGLSEEHVFAVIEMGAGKPGDIASLCEIVVPDVSILLNASAAHLAHFDSVAEIADTKGEILRGLRDQGLAVINADQTWIPHWRQQAGAARQVTFGFSDSADYRACDVMSAGIRGSQFRLRGQGVEVDVTLSLPGQQHVYNALAALAAAIELGIAPELAVAGIAGITPQAGRGLVTADRFGGRVVDDCYNANPAAVRAALECLACESGHRLMILGPMLELGAQTPELHREIGVYAREQGIDQLITVGELAEPAAEGFGKGSLCFEDQQSLMTNFPALPADHLIWVKGSRGAALESLVDWLSDASIERGMAC